MGTKIISWNVNGIRACAKNGLEDFLQKENPDIFCAQEVKAFEDQCTELWKDPKTYKKIWHPAERPGYSGVASFFKGQTPKSTVGMGDPTIDREGRILVHDLDSVTLVNTYFPNGGSGEPRHFFKMKFMKKFFKWLKELDKKSPVVLTGDINIAHREIDIHDPVRLVGTSGFKPEERQWMTELFENGFVDAFRYAHGDLKDQYSWWSYRQGARRRNKGWRIDYFIVSKRFVKKIQNIKMFTEVSGSDHCPLSLEIC